MSVLRLNRVVSACDLENERGHADIGVWLPPRIGLFPARVARLARCYPPEPPSLAPLVALRLAVLGPTVALTAFRVACRQLVQQFVAEYSVQLRLARRRLEYSMQLRLARRRLV